MVTGESLWGPSPPPNGTRPGPGIDWQFRVCSGAALRGGGCGMCSRMEGYRDLLSLAWVIVVASCGSSRPLRRYLEA